MTLSTFWYSTVAKRLKARGQPMLLLWLVLSLLVAQWQGLSHRIEHGTRKQLFLQGSLAVVHSLTSSDSQQQVVVEAAPRLHHHDCAAYDAASLGAGLTLIWFAPLFCVALSERVHPLTIQPASKRSWHAFQSRAPPAIA